MTKQPNAIPLRPDYTRAAAAAPNHVARAAFAAAKAAFLRQVPAELCAKLYPDDDVSLRVLTRAAITPGTTTTSGWASQLVQNAIGNFLGNLTATSAAAALMGRGVALNVEAGVPREAASVNIPVRSNAPIGPHWVTELNPIPVRSDTLTSVPLGPSRKLGSIVVLSRELMKRSDAANIFNTILREDASKSLDAAAFSSEDGLGDAHAGLLNGVSAMTPIPGTSILNNLRSLAAAVSAGGSGQVAFIGGPAFAAAVGIDASINATVLPSPAVPETRLIAVDPMSVIWGAGSDPEIDASEEAVVHMSDDPDAIVAGGTADPVRSMFQTATIATRMLLPVSFAKRRAGAVAYMDDLAPEWL